MIRVETKQRVLPSKADTKGSSSGGNTFGVGNLHQVDVEVGRDKVHAAERVGSDASLPKVGPGHVSKFQGKLGEKYGKHN